MAQYNTLPIYQSCYDCILNIMQLISHFPKEYKYSLGERIQDSAMEMILCIYKANTVKYKSGHLKDLLNYIQMLYLFLRLSHDMKILSTENYSKTVEMVNNVSRQAQGWLNANEKPRELVHATV